jgi:hypothetical protein
MTKQRAFVRVFLIVLAVSAIACDDGPSEPSNPFEGIWNGVMADNALGQVALTLRLTQDPVAAAGTWSATIAGQTVSGGLLAVSISQGGAVTHQLSATCAGGGFWGLTATFAGHRMTGSYGAFSCSGLTAGTIDVVKQ